jgi:hypothetical protein
MSFIQIACVVLVPLLWGYQFVAIKVGVVEFPPLFFLGLRFLAIALLLIPFVRRPTRQEFGPIAVICNLGLPWWTEFRALLCGHGARFGRYVCRRLSTHYALHRPVSLAIACGEAVADYVRRRVGCLRRRGRVGSRAGPIRKCFADPAGGRGSLCVRGRQRLDQAPRPLRSLDVDGVVVTFHGAAGHVDVAVP